MFTRPLVSIGMPLHNSTRYVRAALDSILAQDYPHFELILSDDASRDGTAAICREYAARDARIRYYRLDHNIGAVANFRRVAQLARGTYFMWAAFDDLRGPPYLSACVAALEADPRAVLCCTDLRLIDANGQIVDPATWTHGIRPVGRTPWLRVRALARATYWYDFYGLIRRSALQQTRGPLPVWGYDVVVMMELCLRGRVLYLPEKLFTYRVFPEKTQQSVAAGLAAADATGVPVSWTHLAVEMTRCILLAPLPQRVRLRLLPPFVGEFCLHNPLVSVGIYHDGWSSVVQAVRQHHYRLSAELLLIFALVRVNFAVRYRMGRLRRGRQSR